MTQRFNPPPGWQVPAGFAPTQGWQPDPAWPPAPPGWNFWVDDAAAYGAASQGGYGSASQPGGYGPNNPGMQNAGTPGAHAGGGAYDPSPPTGQAGPYDPSPNTGQPGAYDPSMVPGGAGMALVEQRVKKARSQIVLGAGIFAVGLVINIVSVTNPGSDGRSPVWWGILLVALIVVIRGIVDFVKSRKQLAQAQAAAGGGLYGTGMGGSSIPGSGTSGGSPFSGPSGRGDDLYR